MSNLSIESAIQNKKVNTDYADKFHSDRIFNPDNQLCIIRHNVGTDGREGCPFSFNRRSAGCDTARLHVDTENSVSRPNVSQYITLNTAGIKGDTYGTGVIQPIVETYSNTKHSGNTGGGLKHTLRNNEVSSYHRGVSGGLLASGMGH